MKNRDFVPKVLECVDAEDRINRANSNNMLLASAVVVWEWLNEHGRWRPYSPAVSHQIEAAIRSSDPRGGSVVLGQVDNRLSPYIIDLQSMHQFRQDTGKLGRWGIWCTLQSCHVGVYLQVRGHKLAALKQSNSPVMARGAYRISIIGGPVMRKGGSSGDQHIRSASNEVSRTAA
uniref:E3 ubiquitin-protein ligase DTX1-like n=1 Tax=Pundamilia nyererei TaxID=303518 RepID=A0A3B4FC87_9CICH